MKKARLERLLVIAVGPLCMALAITAAITTDFPWSSALGMAGALACVWWADELARWATAATSRASGLARAPYLWWWARTGDEWALKIALRMWIVDQDDDDDAELGEEEKAR